MVLAQDPQQIMVIRQSKTAVGYDSMITIWQGFRSLKTTALFEARHNQSSKNYPCSSIVMVKAGNFLFI